MSLKARAIKNTSSITTNAPLSVELGVMQMASISVDNFSAFWLTVQGQGMYIPPYTLGWSDSFYGSIAGSVNILKGAPSGIVQATTGNGDVIVRVYDSFIAPSPGVYTRQPDLLTIVQNSAQAAIPSNPIPYNATFPLLMAGGFNEGATATIPLQCMRVYSGFTAVLATTQTLLTNGFVTDALSHLLWGIVSVDSAGELDIAQVGGGLGDAIFHGFVAANTPVPIFIAGNGFMIDHGASPKIMGTLSVAGKIGWTFGFGQ